MKFKASNLVDSVCFSKKYKSYLRCFEWIQHGTHLCLSVSVGLAGAVQGRQVGQGGVHGHVHVVEARCTGQRWEWHFVWPTFHARSESGIRFHPWPRPDLKRPQVTSVRPGEGHGRKLMPDSSPAQKVGITMCQFYAPTVHVASKLEAARKRTNMVGEARVREGGKIWWQIQIQGEK